MAMAPHERADEQSKQHQNAASNEDIAGAGVFVTLPATWGCSPCSHSMGSLSAEAWSLSNRHERSKMLRVRVPIDLGTVATTQSSAFALATPMLVRELLEIAVAITLGRRSPPDRRRRVLESTLEGLKASEFILEIDGKTHIDPDTLLVCSGSVALRFFSLPVLERKAQ